MFSSARSHTFYMLNIADVIQRQSGCWFGCQVNGRVKPRVNWHMPPNDDDADGHHWYAVVVVVEWN